MNICTKGKESEVSYLRHTEKLTRQLELTHSLVSDAFFLPLMWLNLQRCRLASHIFFGKLGTHYSDKKKRIRERVETIKKYLRCTDQNNDHTTENRHTEIKTKMKQEINSNSSPAYKTIHYLAALLKAYGIKHIVASPGGQNATFNLFIQGNPYFQCFSVVDERSAAYTAVGLADAVKNPVAITSTGATAARNYMSAMTESWYSNVPIVALTAYDPNLSKFNLSPQFTDRSVSQNDIKDISITLPEIKDRTDKLHVITAINAALSHAKYNNRPVHLNFPSSYHFEITTLPTDLWTTEYYYDDFEKLQAVLANLKFGIFVGQHRKYTNEEEEALSEFAKAYDAPVFCDHNSNYNGENKVLVTQYRIFSTPELAPDTIIDVGGISGMYFFGELWKHAKEVWRVTEYPSFKNRFNTRLTKLLVGREGNIFRALTPEGQQRRDGFNLYKKIQEKLRLISYPDIPLSISLVAQQLAKYIPENSYLNLAILMALQYTCRFDIPRSVEVFSNVGGFGIDGPLSTALGLSLSDEKRKVFTLIGDLAFFYDMNVLGNRHIGKNMRILIENNAQGLTMRTPLLNKVFGDKCKTLVCAADHYKGGARGWAESCGFEYMSARTKDEFLSRIKDFCNKEYDRPVIFEVFTTLENNWDADRRISSHLRNIYS